MTKKIISLMMTTVLAAGFFAVAAPAEAQAALPCTYDTINDANAQIVAAQNAYAAAQAEEAALRAAFEAVKAEGPSSLRYLAAASALESATNRTKWAYDQITNAQAFLANIKQRETVEDDYLNAVSALSVQSTAQASAMDAQSAQEIANMAFAQTKLVENVIAGYKQQLAVSPTLQTQIDALNAQLVALKADYANKQLIADQKKAAAAAAANALSASNYNKKYIDYINNRDKYRGDPKCECFDFYTDSIICTNDDCKYMECGCVKND